MAKRSAIEKNKKRIQLVAKYAEKRKQLKDAVSRKSTRSAEEQFSLRLQLARLSRNGNPTRVRNRCQLTGRPRGYYRKFGLSRIALRELGSAGLIPGLLKASW